jgi:hypothetical protein
VCEVSVGWCGCVWSECRVVCGGLTDARSGGVVVHKGESSGTGAARGLPAGRVNVAAQLAILKRSLRADYKPTAGLEIHV